MTRPVVILLVATVRARQWQHDPDFQLWRAELAHLEPLLDVFPRGEGDDAHGASRR